MPSNTLIGTLKWYMDKPTQKVCHTGMDVSVRLVPWSLRCLTIVQVAGIVDIALDMVL